MATTFTTSMTAVSAPSGVTAQTLIDRAQNALSDAGAATWSETVILEWLNEAIRAYNRHFKRTRTTTITTAADDRTYDLPADFHRAISVEYPTGDDPPTYLQRRPYTDADFWGSAYYDIIPRSDDQDVDELWIGEKPSADQTITVIYQANHDYSLTVSSYTTVPDRHHDLLILHIIWSAKQERLSNAEQQGTLNALDIGSLNENANSAQTAWSKAIQEALQEESVSTAVSGWNADQYDRIY